ncbi:hypothetical protein F4861DRAFT_425201 [Xylaria intraflava]|nr:hypothetical protein F4861DRAFT_425201 [Xylaria intraflava]
MPVLTLVKIRQAGTARFDSAGRPESSAGILSSGAIAGITIGGSVLVFLLVVGPLLIRLAKRRDRPAVDAGLVTSLPLTEQGYSAADEGYRAPKRLHKRGTVSDHAIDLDIKDVWLEGAREGISKHVSLPNMPPRFPGPVVEDVFSGRASKEEGGGTGDADGGGGRIHGSSEKHRGHIIHQNRRKMSWIDEDALHGPRILPRKSTRRKLHWFRGNGFTRTLSRRFSIRRHHAPELEHSPTLPCTGGAQRPNLAKGSFEGLIQGVDNGQRQGNFSIQVQKRSRFAARQPLHRGGSLADYRNRIVKPMPKQVRVPVAVRPSGHGHSNTVINAAQELAGKARVPSVDVAAGGRRYSGLQPSGTDAELQAILRRTAERVQDGSQSAGRQTFMVPHSSSSKLPGHLKLATSQEWTCGKGRVMPEDALPSPARSQRSAPAVMSNPGPDGGSPGFPQALSQNSEPWRTHRRTHARQMSQTSQVSMLSDSDSLDTSPSRHNSQADVSMTALSSPDRISHASPPYVQQVFDPTSYSPASEQLSVLSTVYSEEEGSPLTSTLERDSVLKGASETQRTVMAHGVGASDALNGRPEPRGGDSRKVGGEFPREFQTDHSVRPLNPREGPPSQTLQNITQNANVADSTGQGATRLRAARTSPKAASTFTVQTLQSPTEDPFTCTATPCPTPQRLSQICSPLPVKLPGDTVGPSVQITEPSSPTPTSSRRRVIPPPQCLRPNMSSPTSGEHDEPRFQIQYPPREPSPVASEGGLSSVYESYQYSRNDDGLEGSQMVAQLSTEKKLAVPQSNMSSMNVVPSITAEAHRAGRSIGGFENAYPKGHSSFDNVVPKAETYTDSTSPPSLLTVNNNPLATSYTVGGALPRSQPRRDTSAGNISELSVYSQDDDGTDRLAPLIPRPMAARSLSRHPMRVTSAVAQLRRMDSQLSCMSDHSAVTTNMAGPAEVTSPTLPALRGGGCSPDKKGVGVGRKNYLSLGAAPTARYGEGEHALGESESHIADSERDGGGQYGKHMVPVEVREDMVIENGNKGMKDGIALRRGGVGRSRHKAVVEDFEQDLSRARQVLRENRGYNLQAVPEGSRKSLVAGDSTIQVAKLRQEEGRASLESLGIYDEKGFLRSPSPRKDRTPRG